eukprot:15236037-Ditylum_brightwellii.AAC.1
MDDNKKYDNNLFRLLDLDPRRQKPDDDAILREAKRSPSSSEHEYQFSHLPPSWRRYACSLPRIHFPLHQAIVLGAA